MKLYEGSKQYNSEVDLWEAIRTMMVRLFANGPGDMDSIPS